jgi:hypothetical protein
MITFHLFYAGIDSLKVVLNHRQQPPRCLNQYNPDVSKLNHPDQMHEHTKIYLLVVSNTDSWHAK